MEIAALPSCEKSLFAGAKVALFFQKIHPDSRVTDCRGVIISINKEFTRYNYGQLLYPDVLQALKAECH